MRETRLYMIMGHQLREGAQHSDRKEGASFDRKILRRRFITTNIIVDQKSGAQSLAPYYEYDIL